MLHEASWSVLKGAQSHPGCDWLNLQIGGCTQFAQVAQACCKKLHTVFQQVHKATQDVSGHRLHSAWTLHMVRTPNDGGDAELSPKVSLMPSTGSRRTQSQRRCLARWANTATASHWNHPVDFFVTLAFVCCGLMKSDYFSKNLLKLLLVLVQTYRNTESEILLK